MEKMKLRYHSVGFVEEVCHPNNGLGGLQRDFLRLADSIRDLRPGSDHFVPHRLDD